LKYFLKEFRLATLITAMERFGAKRITFSGSPLGPTPLVFTQDGGKWSHTGQSTAAPTDKLVRLLDKLSGNHIQDFLVGSAIPAGEKDGVKLVLGDEKGTDSRELLFWKKNELLYGRDLKSGRNEAFLVEKSLETELPWKPDFYSAPASPPADKAHP
jgi:hypothetical protein